MTSEATIRAYRLSDYAAVKQNLVEGGLYFDSMDSERSYQVKVGRDPESILVAELENKVVGSAMYVEDGWLAMIFRLSVNKQYRNRGIGRMLMKEAEDKLRHKGYKEANIWVDEKNEKLHSYYQNQGYRKGSCYRWMYKNLK